MVLKKIAKKHRKFGVFFSVFLVNHFDFLSLRARKNDFNTEIMLETCSATSNYPWDTISWPRNKYWDVHSRKRKKYCEKRQKSPLFGPFWGGLLELLYTIETCGEFHSGKMKFQTPYATVL